MNNLYQGIYQFFPNNWYNDPARSSDANSHRGPVDNPRYRWNTRLLVFQEARMVIPQGNPRT